MLLVEQKLSVQITDVDGIQIDLCSKMSTIVLFLQRNIHQKCIELTISISANPDITKFFNNSQPMPPAPTTNILLLVTLSLSVDSKTPAICAAIFRFVSFVLPQKKTTEIVDCRETSICSVHSKINSNGFYPLLFLTFNSSYKVIYHTPV